MGPEIEEEAVPHDRREPTDERLTSFWIEVDEWPTPERFERIPPFPRSCGVTAASLDDALGLIQQGFYDGGLPPMASVTQPVTVAPGLWVGGETPRPSGKPGIWYPPPFFPSRTVIDGPPDPSTAITFRAMLSLTASEDGGRHHPISSGYRCNCWIGKVSDAGERIYNDAALELESEPELSPGSTAIAIIRPALPELWLEVGPGSMVEICEGSRIVGDATVLE